MGFLAASASICYFQINGTLKQNDKRSYVQQQLAKEGFRSIEQSSEEMSTGWVELDNYEQSTFAAEHACWRDHQVCFSLRQDRRRIPSALYKREVARLSEQFLADKPTLNRVPKGELEQIRDQARGLLMSRTLPTPSFYDVIWDTENNLLRLCSLSSKVIDSFQGLFHQTFPELRLQYLHPLARAEQVIDERFRDALERTNQAQTDSVLEQIEANRWLGNDFLQWLLYRTLNSDSRYSVSTSGPLLDNQPFTAFLDNRLVLVGGGQEGQQKIVVAGPQDHYSEARAALAQGKRIEEATILFQGDEEDGWKLTLKGEHFHFGSFRTPMIRPDAGPEEDAQAEAEAAFLTKLAAVEEGEQMFNSLLKSFLAIRLGEEDWQKELTKLNSWLQE